MSADRIAEWVTATVDRAPPLTDEQRHRLDLLLAVSRREAA